MQKKLAILFFLVTMLLLTARVLAQGVGNVTGISWQNNRLTLQCGADVAVFDAFPRILMVNFRPNGMRDPDTLVIDKNAIYLNIAAHIDTLYDPIIIIAQSYRVEISRYPMRFKVFNKAGQMLCEEPASGGINQSGINLTTSGGNFYGLHNKKSGGLKMTTGGNISAGKQGEAGAPFVWTTKGWGILADVESGRIDYSANNISFLRGSSGSSNVSWSPANPTKNDTITVKVKSTKTAFLHWGVNYSGHNWVKPDSAYWPAGSTLYGDNVAVESPFSAPSGGVITAKIGPFNKPVQLVNSFAFVVRYSNNTWDNNNGNDYHINFQSQNDSTPVKRDIVFYMMFGNPREIFGEVTNITGAPPMFPKYALGFMNSRWGIDQPELLQMVNTYRGKQIPIDAYILDFDWMAWGQDNYGEFRFGPKFPSANGQVLRDSLLTSGVKLFGIRKPRIHTFTVEGIFAKANNYFVDYVTDYFSGKEVGRLNFHRPDVRQWFWSCFVNQGNAYNNGIVGYWNDEADEFGNNFNFLQMQRANYEGQRQYNNKRVWSINRNFYLGAQRYAYGHWSGDIGTGFNAMAEQAPFMLSSIALGSSWWGMDIGGFNGHPSNDNYYRWMQFGAFVPIYRVHGTLNEKREPWFYGTEAEQIATHFIKLRYKLLPYIYTAAYENHQSGLSIARPLVFHYPEDATASDLTDEWMFGENMLVKPVLMQNASSVAIYLPQGKWVDYWNGNMYNGPANLNYPVSHATIPLFVQAGAIIPTAPVGNFSNDLTVQKALILSCYPGESGSGSIYEDDGETYDYELGKQAFTNFSQVQTGSQSELTVNARSGIYVPPQRDYIAEFNFIKNRPDSVILNTVSLPRVSTSTLLSSTVTAWAYDSLGSKCYARFTDDGGANTVKAYGYKLNAVEKVNAPVAYELYQNFPNPFNPSTTISYQTVSGGTVTIKIFDGLGQEVTTLVNEYKAPGYYQHTFNAGGLPSGMYICQIRVNDFVATKKMLLVK
ncbi:MAG: DUF5110 domain-containing protein [Ignavibacteriales bacterium]|nr:DUF5110 domain-containing protein [Ignavibacteriales bacterium]